MEVVGVLIVGACICAPEILFCLFVCVCTCILAIPYLMIKNALYPEQSQGQQLQQQVIQKEIQKDPSLALEKAEKHLEKVKKMHVENLKFLSKKIFAQKNALANELSVSADKKEIKEILKIVYQEDFKSGLQKLKISEQNEQVNAARKLYSKYHDDIRKLIMKFYGEVIKVFEKDLLPKSDSKNTTFCFVCYIGIIFNNALQLYKKHEIPDSFIKRIRGSVYEKALLEKNFDAMMGSYLTLLFNYALFLASYVDKKLAITLLKGILQNAMGKKVSLVSERILNAQKRLLKQLDPYFVEEGLIINALPKLNDIEHHTIQVQTMAVDKNHNNTNERNEVINEISSDYSSVEVEHIKIEKEKLDVKFVNNKIDVEMIEEFPIVGKYEGKESTFIFDKIEIVLKVGELKIYFSDVTNFTKEKDKESVIFTIDVEDDDENENSYKFKFDEIVSEKFQKKFSIMLKKSDEEEEGLEN